MLACIETGVAGLSLEDVEPGSTGPVLLPAEQAIARIRVARQTIDSSGVEVTLTGRSECFLYDHPDPLTESISRLQAYVDAGADVVFAPGIRRKDEIATLVAAMSPTPVNIILSGGTGADCPRPCCRRSASDQRGIDTFTDRLGCLSFRGAAARGWSRRRADRRQHVRRTEHAVLGLTRAGGSGEIGTAAGAG